ncbi:MAG: hypothetical protein AAFQ98_12330 [Bacteroidota bacterium]
MKTIIDGVVYYDAEKDAEMRASMAAERARLIAKMLDGGKGSNRPMGGPRRSWDCEDIVDVWAEDYIRTSGE